MAKQHTDDLLRHIASRYAERYGDELNQELIAPEKQNVARVTPGLDQKVRGRIRAMKRRPYLRAAAALAACFVLALLAPQFLRDGFVDAPAPSATGSAAPAEKPAVGTPPAADTENAAPSQTFEVIPLSFTMPDNFTVSGIEQDQGMSVYYLDDMYLDNVVLTLEKAPEKPLPDGLLPIDIGGYKTYGASTADYNLLTFLKGDIVYTLTCKYDINTLVGLSEHILL